MSRSRRKPYSCYSISCSKATKKCYRGAERAKSKRILYKEIEDPEGDHFYAEDRWSVLWDLEKYHLGTWREFHDRGLEWGLRYNRENKTVEEIEKELIVQWRRFKSK